MLGAILSAASSLTKTSGLPSISINSIRGIGGGAARDASRLDRLKRYEAAMKQGSVVAVQYILGQRDECKNEHERDWYDYSIKVNSQLYPELFAAARAAGKLHEPDDDATVSQTAIERELSGAVNDLRGVVAGTVARVGSGAVTAATQAVGGPANGTPVTIPTSRGTLVLVAVALLALLYFATKRS